MEKWKIASSGVGILVLVILVSTLYSSDYERILVENPSFDTFILDFSPEKVEVLTRATPACDFGIFRVDKDELKVKCGNDVVAVTDTFVEHFRTYGSDAWVRDLRKGSKTKLNLDDLSNDVKRVTRRTEYYKGRSGGDGVLYEYFDVTKDSVKISYAYVSENGAKHRIGWRVSRIEEGVIVGFDDVLFKEKSGNVYWYGDVVGNFSVDPNITFVTPTPADVRANLTVNETFINITSTNDLNWSVLAWWNVTVGITNFTMFNDSFTHWWFNMSNLTRGEYNFTVFVQNTSFNWTESDRHFITIAGGLINITAYVWNSTGWVVTSSASFANIIQFKCPHARNNSFFDCEPTYVNLSSGRNNSGQNSSIKVNQSILNITNTGNFTVSEVQFRVNDTCSAVNLTYSNSSKQKIWLNTTWTIGLGPVQRSASEMLYLYANFSNLTHANQSFNCPQVRMEWAVT